MNGIRDTITGGALRNTNLFHSFSEFNVDAGREVYFAPNNVEIQNILTRVTGNNPSNILGTLGVEGNANLFLINPNGISFGVDARLDVNGSSVGSTADRIIFDNYEFTTNDTSAPPLLTINLPQGLGFRDHPGDVSVNGSVNGSSLAVPADKTLALIGGNVSLDAGKVDSPGSRVELGGLREAGRVDLDADGRTTFPEGVMRGNVSLSNGAYVSVLGETDGSITINSQNLDISGGNGLFPGIEAGLGSADAQAGDIQIHNVDKVTLDNSFISNVVFGIGNAGNIAINTGTLSLENGAAIDVGTFGEGNAGKVIINVRQSVDIRGTSSKAIPSNIVSGVGNTGVGNGGGISLNTSKLTLENGSYINSSTYGDGNAGDINITGREQISMSGTYFDFDSEVLKRDIGGVLAITTGTGKAGNITLDTDTLSLRRGSDITTDALDSDGGNITIKGDLLIAGRNENSDITANARTGNGGKVIINVPYIIGAAPIQREQVRMRLNLTEEEFRNYDGNPTSKLNTSDIAAISQAGQDFQVEVISNTSELEAIKADELPEETVNVNKLLTTNFCRGRGENEFTIVGRGGLPVGVQSFFSTY